MKKKTYTLSITRLLLLAAIQYGRLTGEWTPRQHEAAEKAGLIERKAHGVNWWKLTPIGEAVLSAARKDKKRASQKNGGIKVTIEIEDSHDSLE